MLGRLARDALDLRKRFRSVLSPAIPTVTAKSPGAAWMLWAGLVLGGLSVSSPATARSPAPEVFASETVGVAQLPPEGQQVYGLIRSGGPFPFEKDGVVFGNRERLLPAQTRGYYREYTVATPRARNRGARRIVCGGPPRTPDRCYYTADHYSSFREIIP